jgi:hypothetical protein
MVAMRRAPHTRMSMQPQLLAVCGGADGIDGRDHDSRHEKTGPLRARFQS